MQHAKSDEIRPYFNEYWFRRASSQRPYRVFEMPTNDKESFHSDLDLPAGWEKSETFNEIPYYLNHNEELTQWDHPAVAKVFQSFESLDNVKYAAYRTAKKIRMLQLLSNMCIVSFQDITEVCRKLNIAIEESLSIRDVEILLRELFATKTKHDSALSVELTLNIILKCCDSGRTGCLRSGTVIVILLVLSSGTPREKCRAMYEFFAHSAVEPRISREALQSLIKATLSVIECVGEGGNCFTPKHIPASMATLNTENSQFVSEREFSDWVDSEPQIIVWLSTLNRIVLAETVKHEAKCGLCKAFPIVGLRFKCLKCFNTDVCQNCFLTNRGNRTHKYYHPMKEYCLATTTSDDIKDFVKQMKNKFKRGSTRSRPATQVYEVIATPDESSICGLAEVHCRIKTLTQRLNDLEPKTQQIDIVQQQPPEIREVQYGIGIGVGSSDSTSDITDTQQYEPTASTHHVVQTSMAELLDKGISVSTLEDSTLGGEDELLQKLTSRMEAMFHNDVLMERSLLLELGMEVTRKGVEFVDVLLN